MHLVYIAIARIDLTKFWQNQKIFNGGWRGDRRKQFSHRRENEGTEQHWWQLEKWKSVKKSENTLFLYLYTCICKCIFFVFFLVFSYEFTFYVQFVEEDQAILMTVREIDWDRAEV